MNSLPLEYRTVYTHVWLARPRTTRCDEKICWICWSVPVPALVAAAAPVASSMLHSLRYSAPRGGRCSEALSPRTQTERGGLCAFATKLAAIA